MHLKQQREQPQLPFLDGFQMVNCEKRKMNKRSHTIWKEGVTKRIFWAPQKSKRLKSTSLVKLHIAKLEEKLKMGASKTQFRRSHVGKGYAVKAPKNKVKNRDLIFVNFKQITWNRMEKQNSWNRPQQSWNKALMTIKNNLKNLKLWDWI